MEDIATIECPACGARTYHDESFIGCLGDTHYYRCRACGWTFGGDRGGYVVNNDEEETE